MADKAPTYTFGERINAGNADALRVKLEPFFESSEPRRVILDVGRVRICDSYGLRLLINLKRKADAEDKELVLYRPDHIFADILQKTKLAHVFTIVDRLDELPDIPEEA